ncbi:enoyl-CoA hydratase/isomerase family protein [Variovorax sp. J22R133]|uniref:enoyl-CoA hydratase/isomerase family protein n=1 Tax=Variovorax brevis TaxID=3053503 RepID=UPI002576EB26|nr:enoyl-CoA hydratase/isomerase family protein [Variovorax sp. J22R133]MDM0117018.1 enoyl-CoA hydratase/isomerase family protein [Variovorax sp. J22R133]
MNVLYDTQDGVARLTLNRAQAHNALSIDALHDLRQRIGEARDDDAVRVLVVTGAGEKSFCSGADLKGAPEISASYAQGMFASTDIATRLGVYVRLMDLSELQLHKPVIAAINGYCLGGGLELALQCDMRIASTTASFGLPEAAVGSVPGVSGVHRLLRAVPAAHAMQMALTGERVDAQAALQMGLVSELCGPAELVERAMALARRIAGNAPLAVQAIKRLAKSTAHLSDADAQQLTELYWGTLRDSIDRREGKQAFSEKRSPRFVGA